MTWQAAVSTLADLGGGPGSSVLPSRCWAVIWRGYLDMFGTSPHLSYIVNKRGLAGIDHHHILVEGKFGR